jgi:hypothetical protein
MVQRHTNILADHWLFSVHDTTALSALGQQAGAQHDSTCLCLKTVFQKPIPNTNINKLTPEGTRLAQACQTQAHQSTNLTSGQLDADEWPRGSCTTHSCPKQCTTLSRRLAAADSSICSMSVCHTSMLRATQKAKHSVTCLPTRQPPLMVSVTSSKVAAAGVTGCQRQDAAIEQQST